MLGSLNRRVNHEIVITRFQRQTRPPMSGSLMLSSPVSPWPAKSHPDCASPSTETVRSYQPRVREMEVALDSDSPGSSLSTVRRFEYRSRRLTLTNRADRLVISRVMASSCGLDDSFTSRLALCWPETRPLKARKKPFGPYTDRSYSTRPISAMRHVSVRCLCASTV